MKKTEGTLPGNIQVTLAGTLRMKELRDWLRAEREADFESIYTYLAKLVESWSLDTPPSTEGFDELSIEQFRALSRLALQHIQGDAEGND